MIFALSNDISHALWEGVGLSGAAKLLTCTLPQLAEASGRCYFCKRALNRLAMRAS